MNRIAISLMLLSFGLIHNSKATCVDFKSHQIIDDELTKALRTPKPCSVTECLDEILQMPIASQIDAIDLSENYILDAGIKKMREKIWEREDVLPNLTELNLSFNRITAKSLEEFLPLLKREKFSYLNLVGNAAASIDAEPFFSEIESEYLKKMIIIPSFWIESDNWQVLFKNRTDLHRGIIAEIIAKHKEYYHID